MRQRLNTSLRSSIALLATAGLVLAGCDRGKSDPSASSGTAGSSSAASTNPATPSDAITWETAGNPLKVLKIGDSATYTVAGLTITIRVNSFQPAPDYPKILDEESDTNDSCGSYWLAALTTTFSAKNLTWKDWTLVPVSSLGARYGDPSLPPPGQPGHGYSTSADSTHQPDDAIQASLKAATDRMGKTDFPPVTFDSKAYFPNCDDHPNGEGKEGVSTIPPVGLEWSVWAPRDLDPRAFGKVAVLWHI
ncbi:MAG: hypothetical protein ACRC20_02990 [Segniliparus sp.]|uniref:hypothetical protein n=1 Tax=Segniliparus sp. TaxID=2804064 RepID=UPI003F414817